MIWKRRPIRWWIRISTKRSRLHVTTSRCSGKGRSRGWRSRIARRLRRIEARAPEFEVIESHDDERVPDAALLDELGNIRGINQCHGDVLAVIEFGGVFEFAVPDEHGV